MIHILAAFLPVALVLAILYGITSLVSAMSALPY
jgi:hypothetical protein